MAKAGTVACTEKTISELTERRSLSAPLFVHCEGVTDLSPVQFIKQRNDLRVKNRPSLYVRIPDECVVQFRYVTIFQRADGEIMAQYVNKKRVPLKDLCSFSIIRCFFVLPVARQRS